MAKKVEYHPDLDVQIVMKKKVKYKEYLKLSEQAENKGWSVRAYEIGFFKEGLNSID